jgi:hypothetical protein
VPRAVLVFVIRRRCLCAVSEDDRARVAWCWRAPVPSLLSSLLNMQA